MIFSTLVNFMSLKCSRLSACSFFSRLIVFWSDIIAGKRIIRSSRIFIQGGLGSAESFDNFQEEICPGENLQAFSVVALPTTIGQLVVGEQRTSRGYNVTYGYTSLIITALLISFLNHALKMQQCFSCFQSLANTWIRK